MNGRAGRMGGAVFVVCCSVFRVAQAGQVAINPKRRTPNNELSVQDILNGSGAAAGDGEEGVVIEAHLVGAGEPGG